MQFHLYSFFGSSLRSKLYQNNTQKLSYQELKEVVQNRIKEQANELIIHNSVLEVCFLGSLSGYF